MAKHIFRTRMCENNKNSTAVSFISSLLSMLLCTVCLAGASWAWFAASCSVGTASIESARWVLQDVTVEAVESPVSTVALLTLDPEPFDTGVTVTEQDGKWSFEAEGDTLYKVTVTLDRTAQKGYLLVNIGEETSYLADQDRLDEDMLTFYVSAGTERKTITLNAQWGKYIGEGAEAFPEEEGLYEGLPLLGEYEPAEIETCTCLIQCSEQSVNTDCALCTADHTACAAPACICGNGAAKCTDEARSSDCPVCSEHYQLCVWQPVCTCTVLCDPAAPNGECPVCKDGGQCGFVAPAPVCTCTVLCGPTAPNGECPVCKDGGQCGFVAPAPVCTCTALCDPAALNGECPVCKDGGQCGFVAPAPTPAPVCTCTVLCDPTAPNGECPVCKNNGTCTGNSEPLPSTTPAATSAPTAEPTPTSDEADQPAAVPTPTPSAEAEPAAEPEPQELMADVPQEEGLEGLSEADEGEKTDLDETAGTAADAA